MRTRFRIGPFTFGSSGTRLSTWSGGTGFSVPITNRKTTSYGKIKLGIFSFLFNSKPNNQSSEKPSSNIINEIKKNHNQAYEPWSTESDEKLVLLFREGKSVQELSQIFGRTKGAIRARINKLLLN